MTNENFLIGELAEKAGVSVRTIRYYISEGLLPPPEVRGRYSNYDEDYLHRIRLIRRLKDAYLPIKEIRRKLETESEEEIEKFLSLFESTNNVKEDALQYIANLRADSSPRAKMMTPTPVPAPAPQISRAMSQPDESAWRRIVIGPGVELHISESAAAQLGGKLQAMIAALKQRLQERI